MSRMRWLLAADRLLFSGFALACFSVTFSVTICEAGLVVMAVAAVVRFFLGSSAPHTLRSLFVEPRVRLILWAWLWVVSAGAVSAFFGIDTARSFSALGSDFVKFGACVLLVYACDASLAGRIRPYYIAGACVSALWGLWQVVWGLGATGDIPRASGSLHAITYAEVVSLAAISSVAAFCYAIGKRRLVYGISALLLCCAVLASQGRASLVGLAIALLLVVVVVEKRQRKVLLAGLLLFAAVAGYSYRHSPRMRSVPVFVSSLYSYVVSGHRAAINKNVSGWDRLEMWYVGIAIWRDYPLFGVGPANIKKTFDFYHPGPLSGNGSDFGLANLHNLFLQQAVERGLFGLAAWLTLIGALFLASWRWFLRVKDENTLWLLAALPAFLMMNMTETSFQHALPAFSLFFAVAAAAATTSRQ